MIIVMNKLEQIKKKIFMSMKIMDTSIKGVKESQDYLLAQAYNQGLRDAMSIFGIITSCLIEITHCMTVRV